MHRRPNFLFIETFVQAYQILTQFIHILWHFFFVQF